MFYFENITKRFRHNFWEPEFTALDNLSFSVNEGKIIGFLGANGAGKTTSIKILMDFIRPDSGKVYFDKSYGKNFSDVKSKIGYLPERPFFYPNLTGREFAYYMGSLCSIKKSIIKDQIKKWGPYLKIEFALDRQVRTYSKGMLQRLGFLVSLIHSPRLIILDEPLSGLDPIGRKDLKDAISKLRNEGKTVFFSSHIINDVEEVSSEVIFLENGKLKYQGSVDELVQTSGNTTFSAGIEKCEASKKIIEDFNLSFKDFENEFKITLVETDKEKILSSLSQNGIKLYSLNRNTKSLEEAIYNS